MHPKEKCWLGGRVIAMRVWHASQGMGLARIPRNIAAFIAVRTTTIKEVI
jgi:hypothetical protein